MLPRMGGRSIVWTSALVACAVLLGLCYMVDVTNRYVTDGDAIKIGESYPARFERVVTSVNAVRTMNFLGRSETGRWSIQTDGDDEGRVVSIGRGETTIPIRTFASAMGNRIAGTQVTAYLADDRPTVADRFGFRRSGSGSPILSTSVDASACRLILAYLSLDRSLAGKVEAVLDQGEAIPDEQRQWRSVEVEETGISPKYYWNDGSPPSDGPALLVRLRP
jgi:hypothetical protein